ncbi:MAG: carbohydrate-binding domain-containing protein [Clostridiales Family XIII bacterium]|nr:carbohydrate-binding domain-containing protein [Clostridiales Family XIII bacterium]
MVAGVITLSFLLLTALTACNRFGAPPENSAPPVMSGETAEDEAEVDATVAQTIATDGTHTITGTVDGQILVTAEEVTLILDGATITCADGSAILGKDGHGASVTQNLTVELQGANTVSGSAHGIQGTDNLTVTGTGSADITAGKDGLHAGDALTIQNGTINVRESYEGIEAATVAITGGVTTIHASDDGINAATDTGEVTPDVAISGGEVFVYSGSDGIDSNGTLEITGGSVVIFIDAPQDGDATDVERSGTIQPAVYGSGTIKAGTALSVGGVWSGTAESGATAFFVCVPGLVSGQSYAITADGGDFGNATATTTIQGMMMGGGRGGKG